MLFFAIVRKKKHSHIECENVIWKSLKCFIIGSYLCRGKFFFSCVRYFLCFKHCVRVFVYHGLKIFLWFNKNVWMDIEYVVACCHIKRFSIEYFIWPQGMAMRTISYIKKREEVETFFKGFSLVTDFCIYMHGQE